MKFSVSTLAVVLPLLAVQASAIALAEGGRGGNQPRGGRFVCVLKAVSILTNFRYRDKVVRVERAEPLLRVVLPVPLEA